MADKEKEQLPVPVMPARGARAGVRSDVSRAKEGSYNPVGTGSAWSHNFLNQKPWHPLNFRNQVRKYEAEQKAINDYKAREQAMAEWQAEQEKTATLAFLSPEEAKRQKDRAQISFMYQKPPGLEAALARDRELAEKKQREEAAAAAAAAAASGEGGGQQQQLASASAAAAAAVDKAKEREQQQEELRQRQQQLDRLREDPFAAILAARTALQQSEKFVLKSVEGAYGGVVPGSENQLLLGDDGEEEQPGATEMDEAEALLASLAPEERRAVLAALEKKRKRAAKAARLEQAQELLRSAGIDPEQLAAAERDRGKAAGSRKRHHKEKHKRHKPSTESAKHKKHKKSKKQKRRRHSSGSSSSTSTSSDDESR